MPIGFKEWAVVCEALADGRQSLILRKGGIAEDGGGFQFEHSAFFLFPTRYHEQVAKTRLPAGTPLPPETPGRVRIACHCEVVTAGLLTDWASVQNLADMHILDTETVRERFDYGPTPALHAALVRARRLVPPWDLDDHPSFGGCRSWVDLPDGAPDPGPPVLPDEILASHRARLTALLTSPSNAM